MNSFLPLIFKKLPALLKGFTENNSLRHEKHLQPQPFFCMVLADWILHPSFLFQVASIPRTEVLPSKI
jgi:hypothetical protein